MITYLPVAETQFARQKRRPRLELQPQPQYHVGMRRLERTRRHWQRKEDSGLLQRDQKDSMRGPRHCHSLVEKPGNLSQYGTRELELSGPRFVVKACQNEQKCGAVKIWEIIPSCCKRSAGPAGLAPPSNSKCTSLPPFRMHDGRMMRGTE